MHHNMSEVLVSVFLHNSGDDLFLETSKSWWLRQEHKHIEFLYNTIDIKRASGKYILICTDADLYVERAVAKLVDTAESTQSDIVFFNIECFWESNSDVRSLSPINFAFPFSAYNMTGRPVIDANFFNGVNSYLGACLIKRDFLLKYNLCDIGNENIFIRKCLMYKPVIYTVADYLATHIIRVDAGYRNAFEYVAGELDSYNQLRCYANGRRFLHRWCPIIDQMVNILSMDSAFGAMSKVIPLDYIPQCSIHLVDHCNLNCKSCSHFSCLARAGDFELSPTDFHRDIRQLAKITRGRVKIIELYGGEPLLHPNVTVFMKLARRYFPRALIRLITNGILLPQQPVSFWRAVHRYKILISPTKYPIRVDWDKVTELAHKYKCGLDFFGGTGYFQKTLYHKPLDLNGQQNAAISYINCQHTRCINLYKGRLYHCPIVAYIKYFNRQFNTNLKTCASDSLDIYEKNLNPSDVFAYCARPIPFCRYCMSRQTTRGHPWEQTKKDISEWTLKS